MRSRTRGIEFRGERVCLTGGKALQSMLVESACRTAPTDPLVSPSSQVADAAIRMLSDVIGQTDKLRLDPGTALAMRDLARRWAEGLMTANESSRFEAMLREYGSRVAQMHSDAAMRSLATGIAQAYAQTRGACCASCAVGEPCEGDA